MNFEACSFRQVGGCGETEDLDVYSRCFQLAFAPVFCVRGTYSLLRTVLALSGAASASWCKAKHLSLQQYSKSITYSEVDEA